MKRGVWIALGMLLAAAGGALAIDTGGFTSRPVFLSAWFSPNPSIIRLNTPTSATATNYDGGTIQGPASSIWLSNSFGDIVLNQGMHYNGTNWICDIAGGTGVGSLQVYQGALSYSSGTCASVGNTVTLSAYGPLVPTKIAVAGLNTSAGGCTVNSNGPAPINVNSTCTRAGVGQYNITFTTAFTSGMCIAGAAVAGHSVASGAPSSGFLLSVANGSGTAVDGDSLDMYCVGK